MQKKKYIVIQYVINNMKVTSDFFYNYAKNSLKKNLINNINPYFSIQIEKAYATLLH